MGMNFIKPSEAWSEAMDDILARHKGDMHPVRTGWPSLDQVYFDGLEPGWMVAIGGSSGTGKTAFMSQMLHQMSAANNIPVAYLVFSFEMRPSRLLKRMICYEYKMTMSQLYSVEKEKNRNVSISDIERIANSRIPFLKEKAAFVERPMDAEDIRRRIKKFRQDLVEEFGEEYEEAIIVSVIDHLLLAKGALSKTGLDEVVLMENEMKKEDPNLLQINLVQLNREADKPDRYSEDSPGKHYPIKSDLYGSDVIWQTCDSVMVLANPDNHNLPYYGPDKLPVRDKGGLPYVYLHHLKNREAGRPGQITPFSFYGPHYRFMEAWNEPFERVDVGESAF